MLPGAPSGPGELPRGTTAFSRERTDPAQSGPLAPAGPRGTSIPRRSLRSPPWITWIRPGRPPRACWVGAGGNAHGRDPAATARPRQALARSTPYMQLGRCAQSAMPPPGTAFGQQRAGRRARMQPTRPSLCSLRARPLLVTRAAAPRLRRPAHPASEPTLSAPSAPAPLASHHPGRRRRHAPVPAHQAPRQARRAHRRRLPPRRRAHVQLHQQRHQQGARGRGRVRAYVYEYVTMIARGRWSQSVTARC